MAVVAVAGGTGDVGKTIVDQLLLSGKDKVLVLSRRKASANPPAEGNPETLVIDYKDIDGIAKTLESNNVDTVICAMYVAGSAERAQLNLIKAADKSSTTRRFIPSEYAGYVPLGEIVTDEMRAPLLRAAEALERTRLMYTRVACGMFMDYFGQPRIPSHLRPFNWAINIPLRRAAIPGTGNEPLSLTYSKDVAQFIERLLAEHEWPKYSIICGSDTTLNEVVAIAERVTGDTFQVTYDSISKLKQGNATLAFTESASYGGVDLTAAVGLSVVEGQVALPKEGRLNQKFPDIHPIGIEELIKKAWSQE